MALVGADARRKPHSKLHPLKPGERPDEDVVRCATCGCLWMLLGHGWTRVLE
jgi:hypothetical protein